MWAVIKKEIKSYFYSPVGYVFIGLFLIMFSIFFYTDVFTYQSTNFEYIFYSGATILTFIVPILTMRTFAEERKTGTEQLLLTSPLSITKVVIAKFIAATLIVIITELCTFLYFAILSFFGTPHITKDIYNTTGVIFVNATKINVDTDKLDELNVEENDLLLASEGSYFRTNFDNQQNAAADGEETGTFVVGAEMVKTIQEADEEAGTEAIESKLVIYGENYFISDYQLSQNSQYGAIQLAYNKDLVLNSIAYLTDREEDITARKDTGTVTYTATEQQDTIIRAIIFTVPALIIIVGIVVWQVRRRKK